MSECRDLQVGTAVRPLASPMSSVQWTERHGRWVLPVCAAAAAAAEVLLWGKSCTAKGQQHRGYSQKSKTNETERDSGLQETTTGGGGGHRKGRDGNLGEGQAVDGERDVAICPGGGTPLSWVQHCASLLALKWCSTYIYTPSH